MQSPGGAVQSPRGVVQSLFRPIHPDDTNVTLPLLRPQAYRPDITNLPLPMTLLTPGIVVTEEMSGEVVNGWLSNPPSPERVVMATIVNSPKPQEDATSASPPMDYSKVEIIPETPESNASMSPCPVPHPYAEYCIRCNPTIPSPLSDDGRLCVAQDQVLSVDRGSVESPRYATSGSHSDAESHEAVHDGSESVDSSPQSSDDSLSASDASEAEDGDARNGDEPIIISDSDAAVMDTGDGYITEDDGWVQGE